MKMGKQGRVIVMFVVKKDGSISDVKTVRGVDPYLDKEAERVIAAMPNWKPGKQRGQAVNVRFTVPVTFPSVRSGTLKTGRNTRSSSNRKV